MFFIYLSFPIVSCLHLCSDIYFPYISLTAPEFSSHQVMVHTTSVVAFYFWEFEIRLAERTWPPDTKSSRRTHLATQHNTSRRTYLATRHILQFTTTRSSRRTHLATLTPSLAELTWPPLTTTTSSQFNFNFLDSNALTAPILAYRTTILT